MKSGIRRITRKGYKLELSKNIPNVDTDVDESKAFRVPPKSDQTEKLTRARRQASRPASAPQAEPPPAPTAKKTRAWLRFFGLGGRSD